MAERGASMFLTRGAVLLALAMGLTGCVSGTPDGTDPVDGGGDWTPEWVDGVLQPLPNGFPDDDIVLISRGDPGSRNGIFLRQLREILRPLSPVEIVIEDRPQTNFGFWEELRDLNDLAPDGYSIAIHSIPGSMTDLHAEDIEGLTGLTFADFNPIIHIETQPFAYMQRKDAPWGPTFQGMIDYALAHPGEVEYVSNQVATGNDIVMEQIISEFGIEVRKVPAGSQGDAATAVAAGEGDFTMVGIEFALQHFEAGRADVSLITGSVVPPPWDSDPDVVGSDAVSEQVLWGTELTLSTATSTPDLHREWLFELLSTAAESPEFEEARSAIPGASIDVWDHDQSVQFAEQIVRDTESVIRELGLHWQQR